MFYIYYFKFLIQRFKFIHHFRAQLDSVARFNLIFKTFPWAISYTLSTWSLEREKELKNWGELYFHIRYIIS